jgi:hypothetical protein
LMLPDSALKNSIFVNRYKAEFETFT